LIGALHDPDVGVREAAIVSMKQVGSKEAIEPLVAVLKDEISSVRWHAAKALDEFGWQPPDNACRALRAVALGEIEKATIYGSEAVEPIMMVLKDGAYYQI